MDLYRLTYPSSQGWYFAPLGVSMRQIVALLVVTSSRDQIVCARHVNGPHPRPWCSRLLLLSIVVIR